MQDIFRTLPASALANVSYTLTNQSDSFLVALLITPESAAVLSVTRRASDLIRSVLDLIGFSAYGGFAHLVASNHRIHALEVLQELVACTIAASVALAGSYVVVNASLVSVWVGESRYGGAALTDLIALQLVVGSASFLTNYLYRASGRFIEGSIALCLELFLRVPVLAFGLWLFGLRMVPVAAVIASGTTLIVLTKRIRRDLQSDGPSLPPVPALTWVARAGFLAICAMVGCMARVHSWAFPILVGPAVACVGILLLAATDPNLARVVRGARASIGRRGAVRAADVS